MIELLQALILGVVEGVTEFLPISSTGHLIIANELVGFTGKTADTFDVVIQLGAILAVVFLFRERFIGLFKFDKDKPEGFSGLNGWKLLIVVSIPAGILGFLTRDFIKDKLFNPVSVAIALAVGGVALIIVERFLPRVKKASLDTLTWQDALVVGLFQCLALWPGTSRSAATIVGGMLYGIQRKTAAEFSFFAAVPIMVAATGYDLLKSLKDLKVSDIPIFAVGLIAAFISAWFAVKFFIRIVSTRTLVPFGWYRLALAAVVVILLATSVLK